ncbi:MAG TPA: enoyl-CoA hydratase/isomerase family protein [Streptosporangiaceae bacterium]|jgi:2-(1,2-epoxy-1,2-dihydrophenyl)acetyl-CoA isomerase|nr:enoyl-CoA hydratase/isomerase family protein [Streptosporangiaceae bacterium]
MHSEGEDEADQQLIIEDRAGIRAITMHRPEAGNAIHQRMAIRIADAVRHIDDGIRCVVLGSSGRTFCAGADLAMLEGLGAPEQAQVVRDHVYGGFQAPVMAIAECPVPVIAAVQGPALGAGADLVLACDVRIASTSAWLEETWIKLGVISALGAAVTLSHSMGPSDALDVLLSARRLSAEECLARGLYQRLVAPDDLVRSVDDYAAMVASRDGDAVRALKRLIRHAPDPAHLRDGLEAALDEQVPLIARTSFAARVRELRRRVR